MPPEQQITDEWLNDRVIECEPTFKAAINAVEAISKESSLDDLIAIAGKFDTFRTKMSANVEFSLLLTVETEILKRLFDQSKSAYIRSKIDSIFSSMEEQGLDNRESKYYTAQAKELADKQYQQMKKVFSLSRRINEVLLEKLTNEVIELICSVNTVVVNTIDKLTTSNKENLQNVLGETVSISPIAANQSPEQIIQCYIGNLTLASNKVRDDFPQLSRWLADVASWVGSYFPKLIEGHARLAIMSQCKREARHLKVKNRLALKAC